MSPTQPDALELVLASAAADGRTTVRVTADAVRFGSDAARADVVHASLAPVHAVVAPVKGGGFGLKVADGAPATLDGKPVRTARIAAGAALVLGELAIEVRAIEERPRTAAEPASARRTPLPEIPGYTFDKQLGRGAMGRVWLATQDRLDRKVAVKILEDRLSGDAEFVAKFQAEARAAAALHHSNVVTVFDVGEHEGRHFLALEYMDRGSLEDRLNKEGPLPWRAVLGVLRDAAAGLEYAESKGIVHRDIKPDNLMQNAGGVTKIVDLGLATTTSEVEAGGKIFGTAHFIAPEQARGHLVDARADIYALGVSAWRLLTAKTPFNGENSRAIVKAVLTQPAPALRERVPELPAEVEALVLDLMAKDPDERPASAREVRQRVEALIQHFSTPGAAAASAGDDDAGARRPLLLVVGAIVVVLAVGGAWAAGLFGGDDAGGPGTDGPGTGVSRTDGPGSTPAVADGAGDADASGDGGSGADGSGAGAGAANDAVAGAGGSGSGSSGTSNAGAGFPDGVDEDAALKQFEQQAARALAQVDALDDAGVRRERLTGIVADFPGTTAATSAAERLAAMAEAAEAAATEAAGSSELSVEAMRTRELARRRTALLDADGERLTPQRALAALLDAPVPAGLADDEAFAAGLAEARAELEASILATVDTQRDAARALVVGGDFDAARDAYQALVDWLLDRPDPETEVAVADDGSVAAEPPPLRMVETIAAVEDERDALEDLEARFEAAMATKDRAIRRLALFTSSGLRDALARFDFEVARTRLDALADAALSRAGRTWATNAADGLAPGSELATVLRDTFQGGAWRRQSVAVPGERLDVREVVSVGADGFVVEADGARTDLPFAAFADSTELLDALVHERLEREWRPDELHAIATAFVVAAINEALEAARPALVGKRPGSAAGERVFAAVDRARRWVAAAASDLDADTRTWLEREVTAVERAGALVHALGGGDLGQAAWAADALLERFDDTLIASCLSDASERPDPPTWPPTWPE